MNLWKKEAVARLKSYDILTARLENLRQELRLCRRGSHMERRLRWQMKDIRRSCCQVELGLQALTPEEKIVLAMLYIRPRMGNGERLCQQLGVEIASVYRRRDRALRKFALAANIIEN